jgi:hypothetical protein
VISPWQGAAGRHTPPLVASTIVAAALAGWILARWGSIPAATAAWGSAPGGASAMTAMSVEYGADPRVVAFMQYLRVTVVVLGRLARVAAIGALAVLRLKVPAARTSRWCWRPRRCASSWSS